MHEIKTFGKSRVALAVSSILAQTAAWHASPVLAQEGARNMSQLEEVVVTATRRAESVQDVPLNITAIGGEALEERGISSLAEVGRTVPGLYVQDQGDRRGSLIIVRGLNADDATSEFLNSGGGTVATYLGEIPLYVDLRLNDIERVEVLLGPQGTLYGAGTLGGAIRYIPRRPAFDQASFSVRGDAFTLSESDDLGGKVGATLNVPLSETFALRASVDYLDDPGFIDYDFLVREAGVSDPQPDLGDPSAVAANLRRKKDANSQQTLSGRAALRWKPTDSFEANLVYYFQDQDVGGRTINHRGSFGTGDYVSANRFLEPDDRRNQLAALEIVADLGFAELTSATGKSDYDETGQRDQTDTLITLEYGYEIFPAFSSFTRERIKEETFTQELRLVSKSEGPLSWIVGAFYNHSDGTTESREFTPGYSEFLVGLFGGGTVRPDALEFIAIGKPERREQAAFGEIGYRFTDRWQVTVGARWYDYKLSSSTAFDTPVLNTTILPVIVPGIPPEPADAIVLNFRDNGQSDNGTLFKFNSSYDFTDDLMGYLTVSEGYRIGNVNNAPACPPPPLPTQANCALPNEVQYFPDSTTNYEIGIRSQWLDRRLTLNGSIFYIDWQDPQLSSATANGQIAIRVNGKGAESRGAELSFDARLTDRLSLRGSYAYTQAELTDVAPELIRTIPAPPVPAGLTPFTSVAVDGRAGDRLPGSPEQQGTLYASYDMPLANSLGLRLNYGVVAIGDVLTRAGNRGDGETLGGFTLHSASAVLRAERWSAALYADNLFNKYAETGVRDNFRFVQSVANINGDPVAVRSYNKNVLRPREIGLRFTYDFDL